MRKLLFSVAIATATLAAVPAAAQSFDAGLQFAQRGDQRGGWHRGGPTRAQVNDLLRDLSRAEQRIDRAARQRRDGISPREAISLRREANQIRVRLNIAARNGIGQREFFDLRSRVNRLEQRVRSERRDNDNRRY
ncbi:MAG TPA: hypothetical protein VJS15_03390 [Allosphingosinicella sp.]|nr:hypothetical protein [Allosphingosinicella sp.]